MQPRAKKGGSCCCCCCSFILSLILVVSMIVALLYLWLNPKAPTFRLKSMEIPRYGMSSNPDGEHLYVRTEGAVEVSNPNSVMGISCGETRVALAGGKEGTINLGEGAAEGFTLGGGEARTLHLETETPNDGELVDDAEQEELKEGFKSGTLAVKVEVHSSVGVVLNGLHTPKFSLAIYCPNAKLNQLQGDNNADTPKCSVTLFRWLISVIASVAG